MNATPAWTVPRGTLPSVPILPWRSGTRSNALSVLRDRYAVKGSRDTVLGGAETQFSEGDTVCR